jgi:hypothetical protein
MDHEELVRRFTPAPAQDCQTKRYDMIRALGLNFSIVLNASVPDSRELDTALAMIEDAVMWANKGIAIREK